MEKQKELKKLRRRIDELDKILVGLLNKRTRFSIAIGRIKKDTGSDVLCSEREKTVLENIVKNNTGPITDESLMKIYDCILSESRNIQNELKKM